MNCEWCGIEVDGRERLSFLNYVFLLCEKCKNIISEFKEKKVEYKKSSNVCHWCGTSLSIMSGEEFWLLNHFYFACRNCCITAGDLRERWADKEINGLTGGMMVLWDYMYVKEKEQYEKKHNKPFWMTGNPFWKSILGDARDEE